jgi:hypothetical protein
MSRTRTIALWICFAVIFCSGMIMGYSIATNKAVCHAPTEDSQITDCDYHDGGWYQK